MKTTTTSPLALATAPSGPSLVSEAFEVLTESFEQFCLMAGIESIRLDQAVFFTQIRFALMSAFASSMSFLIRAVRATFGGLPALIIA